MLGVPTTHKVSRFTRGLTRYAFRKYSIQRRPNTVLNFPKKFYPQTRTLDASWITSSRRWATSVTPHSTASDPAEIEALRCLEQGTAKLEEGDVEAAKSLYQRSAEIKRNASSLFNLGVTHYHLKEFDEAIAAWKESISLQPSSPDAHTNLASAYVMCPVSRPDLALHHLTIASSLSPEDPEIAFNLAAVLEATGKFEEALVQYQRSLDHGIEKASIHIRHVSAKILIMKAEKSEPKNQN